MDAYEASPIRTGIATVLAILLTWVFSYYCLLAYLDQARFAVPYSTVSTALVAVAIFHFIRVKEPQAAQLRPALDFLLSALLVIVGLAIVDTLAGWILVSNRKLASLEPLSLYQYAEASGNWFVFTSLIAWLVFCTAIACLCRSTCLWLLRVDMGLANEGHQLSKHEIEILSAKDYIVVEAPGRAALMVRVKQMHALGYRPVGSITKVKEKSKPKLWLAMRKTQGNK